MVNNENDEYRCFDLLDEVILSRKRLNKAIIRYAKHYLKKAEINLSECSWECDKGEAVLQFTETESWQR